MQLHQFSEDLAQLITQHEQSTVGLIGARVPASATIWSESGLAVTVAHAMGESREGAAILHDGRKVKAELLGRDPSTDLALLQLELDPPAKPLEIADGPLRIGVLSLALARSSSARPSAVLGMITSLEPNYRSRTGALLDPRIDVDAHLPAGASGGPLLSTNGQLLGVNTHGIVRGGTTIPASTVARSVQRIQAHGDLRPGFLGVRFSPIRLDDHPDRQRALVVTGVSEDCPAARAGLRGGDVILAIDGQAITRGDELWAALSSRAGVETPLEIWRAGAVTEIVVTPTERPRAKRCRRN